MSSQGYSESGKLFASRRHLYADKSKQPEWNREEKEWAKDEQPKWNRDEQGDTMDSPSIPRHRIPGKQRMPPYYEPGPITVPEPRRSRSASRRRSSSQPRRGLSNEAACTNTAICLPACAQEDLQEPLCVSDAMVMVVPRSYFPSMNPIPSSSKDKKLSKSVSFKGRSQKLEQNMSGHALDKKVAPLYTPRTSYQEGASNWEEESASEETDDGYNTPWGRRLSAIRVSRVKREFDEETVSIEPPEGSLPVCARCGVVVYMAEDRIAAGRHFHSSCFKCFLCSAALDSVNLHERNQEVYCKSCYIRQFGPKGYDYGPGEGALRME